MYGGYPGPGYRTADAALRGAGQGPGAGPGFQGPRAPAPGLTSLLQEILKNTSKPLLDKVLAASTDAGRNKTLLNSIINEAKKQSQSKALSAAERSALREKLQGLRGALRGAAGKSALKGLARKLPNGAIDLLAQLLGQLFGADEDEGAIGALEDSLGGYEHRGDCANPGPWPQNPLFNRYVVIPAPLVCLEGQGISPSFKVEVGETIPAGGIWNTVALSWAHSFSFGAPNTILADYKSLWERVGTPGLFEMGKSVAVSGGAQPLGKSILQVLLPHLKPVEQPFPVALPRSLLPWRRTNTWLPPTERWERGPEPVVKPKAKVEPKVIVWPPKVPGKPPVDPGDWFPRPGPRERQKKFGTAFGAYMAVKVFGALTEGCDAVESMWDALPKKMQSRERAKRHGKRPGCPQMALQIYLNVDKVDWGLAARNAIRNQIDDALAGAGGKGLKRLNEQFRGGHRGTGGFGRGEAGPSIGGVPWKDFGLDG